MKLKDSIFWLGTESSLRETLEAQAEFKGKSYSEEVDQTTSRLLSVVEGVAIVDVKGSLTHVDSDWNAVFGLISYNEIRNAVVEALQNGTVDRILIDIDTNGGSAKGIGEISDFLIKARESKPIDTYISGSAFSAGYWIASATGNIYGGKMAEAGSIGVISILVNQSKAIKKAGYEITVFRGGKYKALDNPYEKLSEKAKQLYQEKIDKLYGFFLDAVSENRGIPRASVQSQVGEGLTFFAEEAVANGLMDEVISFDDLFSRLVKRSSTQTASGRTILTEETDMKKKVLTDEAVAAIASGATPEATEELLEEVNESVEGESAESAEANAGETETENVANAEAVASDVEAEVTASEIAGEGENAEAKGSETELVSYLKEELMAANKNVVSLEAKLAAAEQKAELALANEASLKEIANEYISGMSVGLGVAAINLSDMDTSVVLKHYTEVRTQFISRFKVGGVAEVKDDEPEASSGEAELTPMERASIKTNSI